MNPEDTRTVNFISDSNESSTGVFELIEDDESCRLKLTLNEENFAAEADDYFECLCTIRRQLEKKRIFPLCFGASRNVYPSGMSRSMGGGIKAYQLRMNQPARMNDLVDIFDSSKEIDPASPEEQEAYFQEWIDSLGK